MEARNILISKLGVPANFECVGNEVLELQRLYIGQLELDPQLDEGEYIQLDDPSLELVFKPYEKYTQTFNS